MMASRRLTTAKKAASSTGTAKLSVASAVMPRKCSSELVLGPASKVPGDISCQAAPSRARPTRPR